MYDYLNGDIVKLESSHVVIDVNGIGYKVYMPNPYVLRENEKTKIYIYNHVREDENTLYGFKTEEERDLFLTLINVKGLGPKMALPMLATGSVNGIKDAINRENIIYLKKFPKIGDKVAKQIILDLKGKIENVNEYKEESDELYSVLISLGYKSADVNAVIKQINKEDSLEDQVKNSLKLLLR